MQRPRALAPLRGPIFTALARSRDICIALHPFCIQPLRLVQGRSTVPELLGIERGHGREGGLLASLATDPSSFPCATCTLERMKLWSPFRAPSEYTVAVWVDGARFE